MAINTLVLAKMYNLTLDKSDLKNLLVISSSQLELAAWPLMPLSQPVLCWPGSYLVLRNLQEL